MKRCSEQILRHASEYDAEVDSAGYGHKKPGVVPGFCRRKLNAENNSGYAYGVYQIGEVYARSW